jgi:Methyltransferase domain
MAKASDSGTVDDQYYEVAQPNSFAEKVMIAARDAMYKTYVRFQGAGAEDNILDIGVSDVITGGDNMLERKHPFPSTITAAGLGAGDDFRRVFPEIRYIQVAPGQPLPFPDRHFKTAVSNAVLEHVGSFNGQQKFVEEMVRVSDQAFLTVPNRYFLVEHHTLLPVVHWLDLTFGPACRLAGKSKWSQRETLILMSRNRLIAIANQIKIPVDWAAGYTGIPAGPFSSNLYLNIRRRS